MSDNPFLDSVESARSRHSESAEPLSEVNPFLIIEPQRNTSKVVGALLGGATLLGLAILAAVIYIPIVQDDSAWAEAKNTNTVAIIKAYISTHSRGRHLADATTALGNLEQSTWSAAYNAMTFAAVSQFIADFPNSGHLPRAEAIIGFMLQSGTGGVGRDQTEAVKWYQKAVVLGDSYAQAALGSLYAAGDGVEQNDGEAVRLFKLSAEQGDAAGQVHLGQMTADGRGGLAKDDVTAVQLFKQSAKQNNSAAEVELGLAYRAGRGGLQRDDAAAAALFKKSSDQGNSDGQHLLGVMYEQGAGGLPTNDTEAARLYELSSAQGNYLGQYDLARFYEAGRGGLQQSESEAVRLYKLSADQGFKPGGQAYARIKAHSEDGLSEELISELYKACITQSANMNAIPGVLATGVYAAAGHALNSADDENGGGNLLGGLANLGALFIAAGTAQARHEELRQANDAEIKLINLDHREYNWFADLAVRLHGERDVSKKSLVLRFNRGHWLAYNDANDSLPCGRN